MNKIAARFKLDYPDFTLNVNFSLPTAGVSAIFGRSGSGKTSLLRCIAGLERPGIGELRVNGDSWQSPNHFLPAHKRPIGYVFQEASLFDHLSISGNLDYAVKRAPAADPPIAFDQAVSLLDLEPLLPRHPQQLSGGERQRAAIARALLIQPRLLLMDEPLASLDLPRKLEILPYLERLRQQLSLPIIYVSHAADEVARLADHLLVLDAGRIIAQGELQTTLSQLDFPLHLGEDAGAVLTAVVRERDTEWHLARVGFNGGELWLRDSGHALHSEVRVRVLARDVSIATQWHGDSSIMNILPATVTDIADDTQPGQALVQLRLGESYLVARITSRSVQSLGLQVGQSVWAQIKSVALL